MSNVFPWYQPLVETIELSAATLLLGEVGAGVNELALALALRLINAKASNLLVEPDIFLIEPDNEKIKVDSIREATEFLTLAAIKREKKVLVILQADCMNLAAANALLKPLEEPGINKHILLSMRSPRLLPPPIVSRCHIVYAPIPSVSRIKDFFNDCDDAHLAFCANQPLLLQAFPADWPTQLAAVFVQGKKLKVNKAVSFFNDKKYPVNGWFDGLQKWVSDVIRVSSHGKAVFFPQCQEDLHRLSADKKQQWLNFYAHLLLRKQWINHPLNKELFIREILYDYRQLCSY